MSSYYTTVELEKQRKERLQRELAERLKRELAEKKRKFAEKLQELRFDMQVNRPNEVAVQRVRTITPAAIEIDTGVSGYVFQGEIASAQQGLPVCDKQSVHEMGKLFGALSAAKKPSKLETALNLWLEKSQERAVLTKKDAQDKERLMEGISRIVKDDRMDAEDKINSIKMRVTSYLQGGVSVSRVDYAALEEEKIEYFALCEYLGEVATAQFPDEIKSETVRLKAVIERNDQDAYIMQSVEESLSELGCQVKAKTILGHTSGQLFSIEGSPLCDVFVGADGAEIMFEPVVETRNTSLEKRRQIESAISNLCGLYAELEEKLLERGVVVKRACAGEACVETARTQENLHVVEKVAQKKTQRGKEKAMEQERE